MAKLIDRALRRYGYVRENTLTVSDVARIGHREGIRFSFDVEPEPETKWVTLVKAVAACYGATVSDAEVGYILWNHTGYPGFWMKRPVQECRHQLAAFFKEAMA